MSIRLSGLRAWPLLAVILVLLSACSHDDEMLLPNDCRNFMLERLKNETFPTAREAYLTIDSLHVTPSTDPMEIYHLLNAAIFEIHHSGHRPLALALHTGLLNILEKSDHRTHSDNREMLNLFIRIGASFTESGMYAVGLGYYSQGLEFCHANEGFESFESRFYNNIGILYAEANMYDKALEFFQKSLEINLRTDSKVETYLNYVNFSEIYLKQNNLQAAKEAIQKGMEYVGSGDNAIYIAQMRVQQGDIEMRQKMYDTAMMRYTNALDLFEKEDFTSGEIDSYLHLSKLYLEREQPDSAIVTAHRALRLSTQIDEGSSAEQAYELLSQAYTSQGENLKSVNALKRALSIQDSLIIAEHRLRLEDWEMVGNQAFPQATSPTPTETNAAVYMIIAFVLLVGMITLTYYNLHHRTPAPIDSHKAGEDEFLKEKLTRTDRELQSLARHKRHHTEQIEQVTAELRSVLSDKHISEEDRQRRLTNLLSQLDQLRALLRDIPY